MEFARLKKELTIDELRTLLGDGITALEADPEVGPMFAALLRGVNGNAHAALCALDTACNRPLVRQVRALSQLLKDAIAHALRQPGAPVLVRHIPAVAEALAAAQPLTLQIEEQALNPS